MFESYYFSNRATNRPELCLSKWREWYNVNNMSTESTENKPMSTSEVCTYLDIGRNKLYELIELKIINPLPKNPLKEKERLKFDRAAIVALKNNPPDVKAIRKSRD